CFDSIPGNGRVRHAIFTRRGGVSQAPFDTLNLSVSVPDAEENVLANRSRAYGSHGRDQSSLAQAHLTHGAGVAAVGQPDHGRYVGPVDGLITDEPGCGLAMNYADCAPIFLYDPCQGAIGLGHAGWKGAISDLPGAMVRAMADAFGCRPADLLAAVGPTIGPCCYEVGEPVISAVHGAFAEGDRLLRSIDGQSDKRYFDLPAANADRLETAGVRRIEQSGLCTACRTDLFFSHRAENGRTGRFGAIFILD
ncbi:MAG: peptidoglycan editing factor PgeF, partial [Chloroflexota bacterium]